MLRMQFVGMAQSVTQNTQSNISGAGALHLENVKVSQQNDHHGENLTARKQCHDEKMSLEADQHNENMAHAKEVEERQVLKEERLLLKQRSKDFSNKACGLFWLCVVLANTRNA